MKPMTLQEAFDLIFKSTAKLKLNRKKHSRLMTALKIIQDKLNGAKP
jgi:hypothetical protein